MLRKEKERNKSSSNALTAFPAETYISSLKLGLVLRNWLAWVSVCQRSRAGSRQRIYYFHFVFRQPLIVLHYYCLQQGANLFRLDSTVVSSVLLLFLYCCCWKKRRRCLLPSDWCEQRPSDPGNNTRERTIGS